MHSFIYLASQSPRRRQLLQQIGVSHELLLPEAHEDAEALEHERPDESPHDYVRRVTLAKLRAACQRHARLQLPAAPVLSADTTVAVDMRILGKPRDAQDAAATLALLSGRTHSVITAVAVFDGQHERLAVNTSHVRFAALPADVIDAYVASNEPFGKAGSYAIQSQIAAWIEHIDGSYSGIMGLPLFETAQLLRQAGVSF